MYRPQGVVFLAVEENSSGSNANVLDFCSLGPWDFPVGRQPTNGSIFSAYGTDRHNYMVIHRDGTIAYRAASSYLPTSWSTYLPQIRAALDAALLVPVEPVTWSRLKQLFQ